MTSHSLIPAKQSCLIILIFTCDDQCQWFVSLINQKDCFMTTPKATPRSRYSYLNYLEILQVCDITLSHSFISQHLVISCQQVTGYITRYFVSEMPFYVLCQSAKTHHWATNKDRGVAVASWKNVPLSGYFSTFEVFGLSCVGTVHVKLVCPCFQTANQCNNR